MHVDQAAMRPVLSRTITMRGARFYRSGEDRSVIMFVYNIDSATRHGPREATEADAAAHPQAFEAFVIAHKAEQEGRPHAAGVELQFEPLRPLVVAVDPEGGAPPASAPGPHAQRRAAAAARGETA